MTRVALAAAVLAAVPSLAAAQTKTVGGVSFTVPKGWAVDKEEPGFVGVKSGDGAAFAAVMDLGKTPADELAKLRKDPKLVLAALGGTFADVKVTEGPDAEKDGGLAYTSAGGTAVVKGKDKAVDWDVMLVEGGTAPLAVVSFGDLDKNEAALDALLDSFRKERKKKPAK